jgi:hypothetical protein
MLDAGVKGVRFIDLRGEARPAPAPLRGGGRIPGELQGTYTFTLKDAGSERTFVLGNVTFHMSHWSGTSPRSTQPFL